MEKITYNEYSYLNRNMKFVHSFIDYVVFHAGINGKKGLSIGVGDGVHEDSLSRYCDITSLIDSNYDAEIDSVPYPDKTFDFVFIKSVIEHIDRTDFFLSEIHRVLKNKGIVIIFTPDFTKQKDFFYDDYTHIKPFTLASLQMALLLNGFEVKEARWFWYYQAIWEKKMIPNFFTIRLAYWLTERTKIKYFRWGADRQLVAIGEKNE